MRKGQQRPTFEQIPGHDRSDASIAAELAAEFWDKPLEWQNYVLDVLLARDFRDKYAYRTIGIAVPRQNGKSWDVRVRCFYGMVTAGEKILYTCQHGDTADEMFRALSAVFEDEENEELHDLLKAVRKTNGQQAIYLKNGGMIRFTTRTNSLARGKSYDVIIYDEAQELTRAQQAASLPSISASKQHNTQVIYIGTPPNTEAPGEVFAPMHDRIHDGESPEAAWLEWGVAEIGDVRDRDRWYETNPSLGYLIDEETIEGEVASMSPDDFARERLGWWSSAEQRFEAVIDAVSWDACATSEPPQTGKKSFGVKFSADGKRVALSVCQKENGGFPHVELVDDRPMPDSLGWLASSLARVHDQTACIAIDGVAYAGSLEEELRAQGVPRRMIEPVSAAGASTAAQMLLSKVTEHTLTHLSADGGDRLTDSAKGCTRRSIGTKGWWGFGDGIAPSYPIESAGIALWANETTKRNPEGGMVIW